MVFIESNPYHQFAKSIYAADQRLVALADLSWVRPELVVGLLEVDFRGLGRSKRAKELEIDERRGVGMVEGDEGMCGNDMGGWSSDGMGGVECADGMGWGQCVDGRGVVECRRSEGNNRSRENAKRRTGETIKRDLNHAPPLSIVHDRAPLFNGSSPQCSEANLKRY
ncbi:hypothetical protein L1049_018706 [Liquidambar formosana]|uniref:Uncharacterized protein n=1 Tax=Liquidambar formosana TaxID=63359 RepID=A0AAP0WML3_LIQFO